MSILREHREDLLEAYSFEDLLKITRLGILHKAFQLQWSHVDLTPLTELIDNPTLIAS